MGYHNPCSPPLRILWHLFFWKPHDPLLTTCYAIKSETWTGAPWGRYYDVIIPYSRILSTHSLKLRYRWYFNIFMHDSEWKYQKLHFLKFGGNMMTSSPLKLSPNGQKTSFYLFSIDILYPGSIFEYLLFIFYFFQFFDKNTWFYDVIGVLDP